MNAAEAKNTVVYHLDPVFGFEMPEIFATTLFEYITNSVLGENINVKINGNDFHAYKGNNCIGIFEDFKTAEDCCFNAKHYHYTINNCVKHYESQDSILSAISKNCECTIKDAKDIADGKLLYKVSYKYYDDQEEIEEFETFVNLTNAIDRYCELESEREIEEKELIRFENFRRSHWRILDFKEHQLNKIPKADRSSDRNSFKITSIKP